METERVKKLEWQRELESKSTIELKSKRVRMTERESQRVRAFERVR